MVGVFSKLVVLASCAGLVLGHGKLVEPRAFNVRTDRGFFDCIRFTSQSPCGVGVEIPPPTSPNPVYYGTNRWVWSTHNLDGGGPLAAMIDTRDGRGFSRQLPITRNIPGFAGIGGQGLYNVDFTIPSDVRCMGPGGTCLVRLNSPTGFAGCVWVRPTAYRKRDLPEDESNHESEEVAKEETFHSEEAETDDQAQTDNADVEHLLRSFAKRQQIGPGFPRDRYGRIIATGPNLDVIGIPNTLADIGTNPIAFVINTLSGFARGGAQTIGGVRANQGLGDILRPVPNPVGAALRNRFSPPMQRPRA
ncbi:uncharacterized protein VTP21DRAFT_4909 [Calcarisporiella thermophila]|uniref:uncharacterized protein n=1 Tax=Calcarisporiella thermophila TaxID=911321 RepID=UPI003742A60F